MATHTLGTNANNTLTAVRYFPNLADADVATIDGLIVDDQAFVPPTLIAGGVALQAGIVLSGTTTSGSNAIATVTVSSPSGALLSGIVGSFIYGAGIPSGARVVSVSGTTVTISANATANATVTLFAIARRIDGCFTKSGQLFIPNRGVLTMLPGDYIGVGPAGEVILLPLSALAYSGTGWTYT